jgi:uncharacterized protein YjcR
MTKQEISTRNTLILSMFSEGKTQVEIASEFGVTQAQVSRIVKTGGTKTRMTSYEERFQVAKAAFVKGDMKAKDLVAQFGVSMNTARSWISRINRETASA